MILFGGRVEYLSTIRPRQFQKAVEIRILERARAEILSPNHIDLVPQYAQGDV